MKKKLYKAMLFILPVVVILAIPLVSAYEKGGGVLSEYLGFIDKKSPVVIDKLNLPVNLIEGALSGTDKYSYYLDRSSYQSQVDEYQNASFVGVGITMVDDVRGALVINVFMNSPAQKAGIKAGDVIVSADGTDLAGMALQEIANHIKGPENSSVELGILVDGRGEVVFRSVERAQVDITTVGYTMYRDAAYIRITGFTSKTGEEFRDVLDKIDRTGNRKLIIDIRNNGGGAITGCIEVARALLNEADIVRLDFRFEGYIDYRYRAYENDRSYDVVLLVNGNSASASEILAAALQDNDAGLLVGETTFGKSLVQSTYPILNMDAFEKYSDIVGYTNMYIVTRGAAMQGYNIDEDEWLGAIKLTIGEYLTPNGESINNKGISPDVEVSYGGPVDFDETADGLLWIYDKYDIGMSSEEIKKAKVILSEIGFFEGVITGYYDRETFDAVLRFQEAEGLYPYGVLDFTTQQALNNRLRMTGAYDDPQLQLAYTELMEGGTR